ncbi:MAG: L,D-transpeptidase family protein [Pseudomonadota bacterium]
MARWVARKDGSLALGAQRFPLAEGKGGRIAADQKQEGDGATPIGVWPLRRVYYRPDRLAPPQTALPLVPLRPHDGWCDDPADPLYNRPVSLPYRASHERLWRDDEVYDLIVEIGHNDDPPVPGLGSAIFVHIAREGFTPTEGCIALTLADLITALAAATPDSLLEIEG